MFDELSLKEFALIPELEHDGDLVISPDDTLMAKQRYACGCFLFFRRNAAS